MNIWTEQFWDQSNQFNQIDWSNPSQPVFQEAEVGSSQQSYLQNVHLGQNIFNSLLIQSSQTALNFGANSHFVLADNDNSVSSIIFEDIPVDTDLTSVLTTNEAITLESVLITANAVEVIANEQGATIDLSLPTQADNLVTERNLTTLGNTEILGLVESVAITSEPEGIRDLVVEPPIVVEPDLDYDATLIGTPGNDLLEGGDLNERIIALESGDRLYGDDGRDRLEGNEGDDRLYGGRDEDILIGGEGHDLQYAGPGDDTFLVNAVDGIGDRFYGGSGDDLIQNTSLENLTLSSFHQNFNVENINANGAGIHGTDENNILDFRNTNLENITEIDTGAGNDLLFDNDDGHALLGGAGNDRIYAGGGNDFIQGGAGNDLLYGSTGDDVFQESSGLDLQYGGSGNDTFEVSGDLSITDIFYGGTGFDQIINIGDNDLSLSSFRQYYNIESVDANGHVIQGSDQNDILDFRNTTLENVDSFNLLEGNDIYYGNDQNNIVAGGAGHDRLYGGRGNDTLIGDQGNDQLRGGNGNDYFLMSEGNDVVYGGTGQDWLNLDNLELNIADVGNWLDLSEGHIEKVEDNQITLSDNASGHIDTDQGRIDFDGIEHIEW